MSTCGAFRAVVSGFIDTTTLGLSELLGGSRCSDIEDNRVWEGAESAVKMAEKEVLLAFDLYGTLLSTETITGKLSDLFGDESGQKVAARWRALQLEYTWRLNSMRESYTLSSSTLHAHSKACSMDKFYQDPRKCPHTRIKT